MLVVGCECVVQYWYNWKLNQNTQPEFGKAEVAYVLEMGKMANKHVIVVVTVVLSTSYFDLKYTVQYVCKKSSVRLTDINACALMNDLI